MYYVLFIIQIFSVNLLLSGFCVEDMCVYVCVDLNRVFQIVV